MSEGIRQDGRIRAARQKARKRFGSPPSADVAMLLDLTGALLISGVGIEASLDRLATCVPGAGPLARVHRALAAGAEWEQAWASVGEAPGKGSRRHKDPLIAFGEHLAFAHSTGAPTVELLQVSARQARAERRQDAERRAARLGVQMVVPLGLCFLPAFVMLGVVPVVLGMLPELTL